MRYLREVKCMQNLIWLLDEAIADNDALQPISICIQHDLVDDRTNPLCPIINKSRWDQSALHPQPYQLINFELALLLQAPDALLITWMLKEDQACHISAITLVSTIRCTDKMESRVCTETCNKRLDIHNQHQRSTWLSSHAILLRDASQAAINTSWKLFSFKSHTLTLCTLPHYDGVLSFEQHARLYWGELLVSVPLVQQLVLL